MKTCQLCGTGNALHLKLQDVVPADLCSRCLVSDTVANLAGKIVAKTHGLPYARTKINVAGSPATVLAAAQRGGGFIS